MATVNASMKWAEGLRFEGVSAFGHPIATDVSRAGGGTESGYRPSELVLFGLAGCTGVDVVRILKKMQQKVSGIEIQVTAHQNDEYPKPFHTVDVKFIVTGENLESEKVARAIALSEEKYCLVSQTIQSQGKVITSFEVRER
jgi:putative redox protein